MDSTPPPFPRHIRWAGRIFTLGVSMSTRIFAAVVVMVAAVGAYFFYSTYNLQKLTLVSAEALDERVPAMLASTRVRRELILHDNLVFRFLATGERRLIPEMNALRTNALRELQDLENQTASRVVLERIEVLRRQSERYFDESNRLLNMTRNEPRSESVGFWDALGWIREQGIQKKEVAEASSSGEQHLVHILTLCDELVSLNRAALEQSQENVHAALETSRRATLIGGVLVGMFVILVGAGLALSLVLSFRFLLTGIQRAQEGDLSVEIPLISHPLDEFGRLTTAFNRMIRTILEQRQRLVQESILDGLTGAYNYRHFRVLLDQELERSRRESRPVSLLMVDIDHFKSYNDRQGHEMGSDLLRRLCRILRDNLRDMDSLARYGGDELGVILPGLGPEDAMDTAERLRQVVAKTHFPGEDRTPKGRLTVSLGGASYPLHATDADDLIVKADKALYAAKAAGRDTIRWWDPAMPFIDTANVERTA